MTAVARVASSALVLFFKRRGWFGDGPGRHDQNRAARDADEAGRDATEERRFESAASTGADDDHFGFFLIGEIGEPLGCVADDDASICLLESHCSC